MGYSCREGSGSWQGRDLDADKDQEAGKDKDVDQDDDKDKDDNYFDVVICFTKKRIKWVANRAVLGNTALFLCSESRAVLSNTALLFHAQIYSDIW